MKCNWFGSLMWQSYVGAMLASIKNTGTYIIYMSIQVILKESELGEKRKQNSKCKEVEVSKVCPITFHSLFCPLILHSLSRLVPFPVYFSSIDSLHMVFCDPFIKLFHLLLHPSIFFSQVANQNHKTRSSYIVSLWSKLVGINLSQNPGDPQISNK